jgi:DNA-binding GntR family transcriptional regulator
MAIQSSSKISKSTPRMSENGIQSLEPLVHESLKSKVARTLRTAIQSGQLKPGQHLVEEELAQQLGVSRVPVREAIRVLETDGLLVTEHGRGASVANPSDTDIEEIYGLRIALESYCLAQVIDFTPDDEIASLQRMVDQMYAWQPQDGRVELLELDLDFHKRLCELADNEKLLQTWSSQIAQLRMLLVLSDAYLEDPGGLARGHERIVEAIRNRDIAKARVVLQEHFNRSKERIIRDRTESKE